MNINIKDAMRRAQNELKKDFSTFMKAAAKADTAFSDEDLIGIYASTWCKRIAHASVDDHDADDARAILALVSFLYDEHEFMKGCEAATKEEPDERT